MSSVSFEVKIVVDEDCPFIYNIYVNDTNLGYYRTDENLVWINPDSESDLATKVVLRTINSKFKLASPPTINRDY